jgi:hypothetical protein
MAQYAAALDGVAEKAVTVGAKRTVPGSVNALIVSYYRSPEFRGLKASTQTMRRNIIERFRVEHATRLCRRLGNAAEQSRARDQGLQKQGGGVPHLD